MIGIVPGTFDPITRGHVDIITRASRLCSGVIVAVGTAPDKRTWFSLEERMGLVREATADLPGVSVDSLDGLLVQYAADRGAQVLIKGLRSVSDFDYELQMAQVNRQQAPAIETLFLATSVEHAFLSSSLARELARYGGAVEALVPACVLEPLRQRAAERREGHHATS